MCPVYNRNSSLQLSTKINITKYVHSGIVLTMAVGRLLVQPPMAVKLNGLIVAINPYKAHTHCTVG